MCCVRRKASQPKILISNLRQSIINECECRIGAIAGCGEGGEQRIGIE